MLNPSRGGFFWEEEDDRAVLSGSGLRIAFARLGDCWTHLLSLPEAGGIEVARVVESQPDNSDPACVVSPLYQELHRHELADDPGACLLLTGRLFDHHFSAAVTLQCDSKQPHSLVLDFDIADRCRAPLESLAATYLVGLDTDKVVDASPSRIVWNPVGPERGGLELVAEAPSRLAMDKAGPCATLVQAVAMIEPRTFTQRLHYRWRWTNSGVVTR